MPPPPVIRPPNLGPRAQIPPAAQAQAQPQAQVQQQQLPPAPPAGPPPATQQQLLDNQQQVYDFLQRFGLYIEQDKNDREAIRKAAQQEHIDRLQNDRDRAARQKELHDIKEADIRAKEIPKCDGCTPELTRKWIQSVELTIPYTTQTIRVASLSSIDDLHTELELFLNQNNRNFVTWASLKKHLTKHFLTLEEQEHLCNNVDSIIRGPAESIAKYGRRFKRAVNLAYPLAQGAVHPPMSSRFLKSKYLNGLNHPDLMGRILREGRPDTYEQAMDFAARYEADEQNIRAHITQCNQPLAERIEEPMDVNMLQYTSQNGDQPTEQHINAYDANHMHDGTRPKRPIRGQSYQQGGHSQQQPAHSIPTPSSHDQNRAMANMQRQITGLFKQFTELMSTLTSNNSPRSSQKSQSRPQQSKNNDYDKPRFYQAPLEYTMDGRPICLYCKNPGHMKKDCRKKAAADLRRTSGNQ